ncbi:inositol hexaphosphate kinase kcs1 [Diplodia corticola]|uniref:Kinase n=1 Tax=Diplodia corticola TaxID=236234 RepID=A0A1J9SDS6_9PEZI|nr:inositol hexaphosphate kinase kcs1 [Diplodia corticola]OJD37741.1 inositol hexaphosphate kinase kcs1 [Diplodia corticola]
MSSAPSAPDNTSPSTPVRSNRISQDRRNASSPPSPDDASKVTPKTLSQTGRSRTAPLSLESLYPAAGPQLSERDSIFATNYIPTDSPAESPRLQPRPDSSSSPADSQEQDQPSAMAEVSPIRKLVDPPLLRQAHHHHLLSAANASSPLEHSTFAEDYHNFMHRNSTTLHTNNTQQHPKGHFITQILGGARTESPPKQDSTPPTAAAAVDSPHQHTGTPRDAPPTPDAFDTDERVRYRSWREGKPTLSVSAHQNMKETTNTRVDKKIEATLPKAEPSTVAARSRKASHYLGLFKENEAAQEQKKRDERAKDRLAEVAPQDGRDPAAAETELRIPAAEKTSDPVGTPIREDRRLDISTSPRKPQVPPEPICSPSRTRAEEDETITIRPHGIPINLLEEIRNFHNLTPGGQPGTPLSQALSTAESQRARPTSDAPSKEPSDYFGDADTAQEGKAVASDEDEESEREHISSALYFPHRQLTPTKSTPEQLSPVREESPLQRIVSRSSTRGFPAGWRDKETTPTPDEVQISLQTQDEQKYLHGDLKAQPRSPDADLSFVSESDVTASDFGSEYESCDESAQSTQGYDSATEELGTTPTQTSYKKEVTSAPKPHHHHHHRHQPTAPLGAVELKPYDHQVGGHSTVYRFSRRAVCKQLNNRENEFYETVERNHPELLDFLPRYIGVLNVTYRKAPKKRKATKSTKDLENGVKSEIEPQAKDQSEKASTELETPAKPTGSSSDNQPRLVSHSQQMTPAIPQVIFENNMHIIPDNLFRLPPRAPLPRPHTGDASLLSQQYRRHQSLDATNRTGKHSTGTSPTRPELKHHPSWGATTVNRRLREQVLKEVFTPPTIHHHFRHDRSHHSLPGRKCSLAPDAASSGNPHARRGSADVATRRESMLDEGGSPRKQVLKSEAERHFLNQPGSGESRSLERYPSLPQLNGLDSAKDVVEETIPAKQRQPRRRHSGGGLRRRPTELDEGGRGHLEYHEEDGYGGDGEEDVFAMDEDKKPEATEENSTDAKPTQPDQMNGHVVPSGGTGTGSMLPAPVANPVTSPLPTVEDPSNPKEAAQPDERVQHFILLEDLTAGMSRPCVLDLKMGTRQYGIEANEKKQRSQRRKCQMTTSRELGVRVCGMQVWNVKTQSYVFEDKYFGRDLKAGKEFQDALTRFFFDGHGYTSATKHIPVILEKISTLERMIRRLPGYRFYASSLLMLYDRGDSPKGGPSPPRSRRSSQDKDNRPTLEQEKKARSEIKLKIVDFANCVTAEDELPEDISCPPSDPDGVDKGYLRGLRTLRMYFQRIWRDMNEDKGYVERGECEGLRLGEGDLGHGMVLAGWEDGPIVDEDSGNVSV